MRTLCKKTTTPQKEALTSLFEDDGATIWYKFQKEFQKKIFFSHYIQLCLKKSYVTKSVKITTTKYLVKYNILQLALLAH